MNQFLKKKLQEEIQSFFENFLISFIKISARWGGVHLHMSVGSQVPECSLRDEGHIIAMEGENPEGAESQ